MRNCSIRYSTQWPLWFHDGYSSTRARRGAARRFFCLLQQAYYTNTFRHGLYRLFLSCASVVGSHFASVSPFSYLVCRSIFPACAGQLAADPIRSDPIQAAPRRAAPGPTQQRCQSVDALCPATRRAAVVAARHRQTSELPHSIHYSHSPLFIGIYLVSFKIVFLHHLGKMHLFSTLLLHFFCDLLAVDNN